MKLKIFCPCSLFPSWSAKGLINTPVPRRRGKQKLQDVVNEREGENEKVSESVKVNRMP
jgi:hypothetical protein